MSLERTISLAVAVLLVGCFAGPTPHPTTPDDATVSLQSDSENTETAAIPVMTLLSVTPASGPTSGLTEVELRGHKLGQVKSVRFGFSPAIDFFAVSDELIVARTPPHPRGAVDVTVVDVDGQEKVLELAFSYVSVIEIGTVEPNMGDLSGGTSVTVTGRGFTDDSFLLFGGRLAIAIEVISQDTILAVVPEGDTVGPVDVHVSNPDGHVRLAGGFTYSQVPAIKHLTPAAVRVGEPATVILTGQGFLPPLVVQVDGQSLKDVVVLDEAHLELALPTRHQAGHVDVAVITSHGSAVASGGLVWFDPSAPPQLSTVYPATGTTHGGDYVTLTVNGLTLSSEGTRVYFGEEEATVVSIADNQLSLAVLSPPAGAAGGIAIRVETEDGDLVGENAYTYVSLPVVDAVSPSYGSYKGGTRIRIKGSGFGEQAVVRIGGLSASDVIVVDGTAIDVTTPPGSPGLASIQVYSEGHIATLKGGFAYQAPAAIWLVTPDMGSVAGGTLTHIYGTGFEGAHQVRFDGAPAKTFKVVSPTIIQAKTPPGSPGAVTVGVDGFGSLTQAFIYFDPTSESGIWGEPVSHNVNVTVFDYYAQEPLKGASVVVGTGLSDGFYGTTDANGQLTIGQATLLGQQLITVSKQGYQTVSIHDSGAENVSIPLRAVPTCEMVSDAIDCGPEPEPGTHVEGDVGQLGKGVKLPWGSCDDHPDAPEQLCDACETDADCGAGICASIPGQGKRCTERCLSNNDCPEGFICLPLEPASTLLHCAPSPGEVRTYCDVTNPYLESKDAIPWPGLLIDEGSAFAFPARLGDMAIFCWTGLYKNGVFTPQVFGVSRNLGGYEDGELVEAQVEMNHPLNKRIEIVLDRPNLAPPGGDDEVLIRVVLNLGGDGVVDFPLVRGKNREPLMMALPALTGDLHDASWTFHTKVHTEYYPDAGSEMLVRGVRDPQPRTAWRLQEGQWSGIDLTTDTVFAMDSAGEQTLAVGANGLILKHYAGASWAQDASWVKEDLRAVSVTSSGQAVAVGDKGVALHFDGTTWQSRPTGTTQAIRGVWLDTSGTALAVVGKQLLSFDGAVWTDGPQMPEALFAIDATGQDNVWVAGEHGYVAHFDGVSWQEVSTGDTRTIRALRVEGETVIAVGDGGLLLTYSANGFVEAQVGTANNLKSTWSHGGDYWVGGERGTLLHFDGEHWVNQRPDNYTSTFYAIAGKGQELWAMGSHELVFGPMMAIPEYFTVVPDGAGLDRLEWVGRSLVAPQVQIVEIGNWAGPCEACGATFLIPYTEWRSVSRGDLNEAMLLELSALTGQKSLSAGEKSVRVTRAYVHEDFNFDHTDGGAFYGQGWHSWSYNQFSFVR
jgi:hypothetical protein